MIVRTYKFDFPFVPKGFRFGYWILTSFSYLPILQGKMVFKWRYKFHSTPLRYRTLKIRNSSNPCVIYYQKLSVTHKCFIRLMLYKSIHVFSKAYFARLKIGFSNVSWVSINLVYLYFGIRIKWNGFIVEKIVGK